MVGNGGAEANLARGSYRVVGSAVEVFSTFHADALLAEDRSLGMGRRSRVILVINQLNAQILDL